MQDNQNPPPPPPNPPRVECLVRTCLVCGKDLVDRKCKLVCPRCGYYASCSDFI